LAAVAGRAQPNEISLQNFLFHAEQRHSDDLTRIVPLIHRLNRADRGAGLAPEAYSQALATGLAGNLFFE
jgi:hypothetical protein